MSKTPTVLIAGGSGLVGSHLTELLQERGYNVAWLGRNPKKHKKMQVYKWGTQPAFIEKEALERADYIVNLAGAGVADKRWSPRRKEEILSSRVDSCATLADGLSKINHHVKAIISASAIGYYGLHTGDAPLTETDAAGTDFLADVTRKWEDASGKITGDAMRSVTLRIGVVLSYKGGALPKMAGPVKWGIGAPVGTGRQYVSWIHIDDLCDLIIHAIENERVTGVYNAVASAPETNRDFTLKLAGSLGKKIFMPAIPAFVIKWMYGEMGGIVLGGNRVMNEKIKDTGFRFKYDRLEDALRALALKL